MVKGRLLHDNLRQCDIKYRRKGGYIPTNASRKNSAIYAIVANSAETCSREQGDAITWVLNYFPGNRLLYCFGDININGNLINHI